MMKIVTTTSLPAVDRPNADPWNTARYELIFHRKYGIEDSLSCLRRAPQKGQRSWKRKSLSAENNRKKNVSLAGLRGWHHPALSGLITSSEVKAARIHLKMLSGDYLTFSISATQSGGTPYCRCFSPTAPHMEDLAHILAICETYTDIRKRMLPGFLVPTAVPAISVKYWMSRLKQPG